MATIMNRSKWTVSVKNREDLNRTFPFNESAKIRAYIAKLRKEEEVNPDARQAEDTFLIRIRQKGYAPCTETADTLQAAEDYVLRIKSERRSGLFIDYSKAHRTTMAKIMKLYIDSVCDHHKGGYIEEGTLLGFINDSDPEGKIMKRRKPKMGPTADVVRHVKRRHLEWMHKPFGALVPTDIEKYVLDRIRTDPDDTTRVSAATVDREIDLLSQVITWARDTLRIHIYKSPLEGLTRPKYCNERNRRLVGDEESRLFKAAHEEDQARCLRFAINAQIQSARIEAALLPNASARKRYIKKAREAALHVVGTTYTHVPLYETLIDYALTTSARRSNTLGLLWSDVQIDGNSAFYPITKNGRPQTAPLRDHLIERLRRLPRTDKRVFPISFELLKGAWRRICKRAGIKNLHIHDLRHEAISRIAEVGHLGSTPFTLLDLAAISGHRDLRMLARYAHLCPGHMARRLDEAFAEAKRRLQLKKGRYTVRMGEVLSDPGSSESVQSTDLSEGDDTAPRVQTVLDKPYNTRPV
jgi:integrase